MERYKIIRFFKKRNKKPQIIKRDLTKEEAKAWTSDPETSSLTCTNPIGEKRTRIHGHWFDASVPNNWIHNSGVK